MPGARTIIALLTDFGPGSEYVGALKAVLAREAPDATVVDLCHTVGAQQVREGAWLLRANYRFFPDGTIFLAVVDPGVGSTRAAVVVRSRRYLWVAPDNGLIFPAVAADGGPQGAMIALDVPPEAAQTFHGRDLFAPAAGRLARGAPPEALGQKHGRLVPLRFFRRGPWGEVVRVDGFGNLVTNLPPPAGRVAPQEVRISWSGGAGDGAVEARWVRTYAEGAPDQVVVLVGSSGTLEISRVNGSAAACLPLRTGSRVAVRCR